MYHGRLFGWLLFDRRYSGFRWGGVAAAGDAEDAEKSQGEFSDHDLPILDVVDRLILKDFLQFCYALFGVFELIACVVLATIEYSVFVVFEVLR